jgi:hypothetical protein
VNEYAVVDMPLDCTREDNPFDVPTDLRIPPLLRTPSSQRRAGRYTEDGRVRTAGEALRRELLDSIWHGIYQGDAPVTPSDSIATATWIDSDGGAVYLLANYDDHPLSLRLDADVTHQRTVETGWRRTGSDLELPPRSLTAIR